MSGGGGQGVVSRVAGLAGNQPTNGPVPGYVPPSQLSQGPVNHIAPAFTGPRTGGPGMGPPPEMVQQLAPQQLAPQQMSPFVQQMMMQRQMPQFNPFQQQMMGLPAALMQMQGRLNQPMMRGPMPQYGRLAQMNPLAFRPDMTQANQSLSRVRPSVYKTDLDAARARVAELEARLAPPSDGGGGGGGSGD
jgi:hypothetical protein